MSLRYQAKHRATTASAAPRLTVRLGLAVALAMPVAGVALPAQAAPVGGGGIVALPMTPAASGTWTVAVPNANVRTGPGTRYPVAGTLARGSVVNGTQHSPGWVRISRGRYIANSVLGAGGGGGTGQVTVYVNGTGTERSGPGTGYPVNRTHAHGTRLTGAYHTSGWFRVAKGRFIAPSQVSTTPGAAGRVTGQQVLGEASRYAGIMYRAGGSTPAGFDCSGYTQYVFGRLGLSIPRTVADQKRAATAVSTPRPGDLVFFGTYHAAIYAGDGHIWDSGRQGLPVQRRAIWSYADVTYGRVAGVSN